MKKNGYLILAALIAAIGLSSSQRTESAPEKNKVQDGQKLYARLHCASCHSIDEVGGCIGPPMAAVTRRRSLEYLSLRLSANKEDQFVALIKHPELFQHPRFQPAQVEAIIAYLKTLDKRPTPRATVRHKVPLAIAQDKPMPKTFTPAIQTPSTREGRQLFLETGCMACHSVGNTGGSVGPALDGVGARQSRQFIEAHITDPQAHIKGVRKGSTKSAMVQVDLFPDQVKAITDYLLTLPTN